MIPINAKHCDDAMVELLKGAAPVTTDVDLDYIGGWKISCGGKLIQRGFGSIQAAETAAQDCEDWRAAAKALAEFLK